MSNKAIYYDSSKCTACKGCQVACKCWNGLPSPTGTNANTFSGTYQNPPELNGDTRLIMTFDEQEGGHKGIKWAFGRRACQHCANAGCVSVCPSGALYKDAETGMTAVDESKCIGCRRCAMACPYDVPQFHGPKGTVNKCTSCLDRVENGLAPACVTTCQSGALLFGEREELLVKAKERVEWLHEHGYEDACIYGETELDGLNVIHVLKYGKEAHGAIENPTVSPVAELSEIMKPITGVATGVTVAGLAAMFALGIGYKRDKLVYNAETEDTISLDTGEVTKHGDPADDKTVKEHIFENLPLGKGGRDE